MAYKPRTYKRKSKEAFGDYNRVHKHLPYGYNGHNERSIDDKFFIPVVNKTSVRMETKRIIKQLLED